MCHLLQYEVTVTSLSAGGAPETGGIHAEAKQIAKQQRKYAKSKFPNNSRALNFTIYLPNLVYWVGCVTGITFTMHLWIVDFIYFWLVVKISLQAWAAIFERKRLVPNLSFFLVFSRTLIPECVYRPQDHFIFLGESWKNKVNTQVKSWFVLVFFQNHFLCLF